MGKYVCHINIYDVDQVVTDFVEMKSGWVLDFKIR